jgi:hypothetical protein
MNLKPLEQEIRIARKALQHAEDIEVGSGFDIDATMDRKHCEGWAEALDYAYILLNGAAYYE